MVVIMDANKIPLRILIDVQQKELAVQAPAEAFRQRILGGRENEAATIRRLKESEYHFCFDMICPV